ncbi:hypothetical protein [Thalassiella azotivora]
MRAVAGAAVGAVLLVGCTGGGEDAERADGATEQEQEALSDTAGTLSSEGGQDAEAVPVETELPVVAERSTTLDEQPVTIAVNGVVVQGELMSVLFTVVNDSADEDVQISSAFGGSVTSGNHFTTAAVTVLDGVNGNLHQAAMTEDDTCVCSGELQAVVLPPDAHAVLTTTFTAVPEDVETVTVTIPLAGAFTDVPVTR